MAAIQTRKEACPRILAAFDCDADLDRQTRERAATMNEPQMSVTPPVPEGIPAESVGIQINIQDMKPVFVAWTNSDLTEGRGISLPFVVTDSPETAHRLGAGKAVQGADCRVSQHLALKVDGLWLIPGYVHTESQEDRDERLYREKKQDIMEKALEKGLTVEDIRILTGE